MDAEREKLIREVWRSARLLVDWRLGPVWTVFEPPGPSVPYIPGKPTLQFRRMEDDSAEWVECEGVLCELRKK